VEVKIGIQHGREIVLESAQAPDEVEKLVTKAIAGGDLLQLLDEKGRRVIIPVDKLTYVEIAEQMHRPVGFAPG
jgi:hypothetical protein